MKLDLHAIELSLPINKHRLDDELEIQADIHYRLASKVADLNEKVSISKEDLKICEAGMVKKVTKDDVKLTVKQMDAAVQLSERYQEAANAYRTAQYELEKAQGLLDAWRQKGFALKVLADLSMASYYAVDSTTERKERLSVARTATRSRRSLEN